MADSLARPPPVVLRQSSSAASTTVHSEIESSAPHSSSSFLADSASIRHQSLNRLTYSSFEEDARYRTMVKYLYGRVTASQWISTPKAHSAQNSMGVLLRKARGKYVTEPAVISPQLLAAVQKLNVEVAFTMQTETTDVIMSTLEDHQSNLLLTNGSQLQVIDSLEDIIHVNVKKFQYACLLREERIILIWHDDLQRVLPHATQLEEKLLSLIWGSVASPFQGVHTSMISITPGASAPHSRTGSVYNFPINNSSMNKLPIGNVEEGDSLGDEEKGQSSSPESLDRPVYFISAVFIGIATFAVVVLFLGFAASKLVVQSLVDGNWVRMAYMSSFPVLMLFAMFFLISIVGNVFQVFGPIGGAKSNSRYFSAVKPDLRRAFAMGFEPPHITIQMPVYIEGLDGVIKPTVKSLKEAISHYESHGGTASIFVNDDGMNAVEPADQQARQDFYHDNNIGWVARPKHNTDGFVRKGKFKKASNMNFALNVAQKVEGYMQSMMDEKIVSDGTNLIDAVEEDQMYREALDRVLKEDSRVTAAGNIRMGEIILIVDSDTRVPHDCLLYGAAEMFFSPEVAIVQHSTGVMQVAWDYFENGITFFTNIVYSAINFSSGCGEVAPFVGHNAFLRWKAVQSVGIQEPDDYVAYWSESHVSEDFDIALRLQIAGNVVRCANYHNNEFKEGVSLTIYDELARWEKYAYGCSELVFHPFKYWLFKGPFTPLFRRFLFSNMIMSSKCTILAYIVSYFALASGATLTLMNYFLIGWFSGEIDKVYMESWTIFVSLIAVFNVMVPVSLAILRYRLGEKGLFKSLLENFRWMPMFSIFFGGLSFHLSCAILAHLFSIDMTWGATAKEKENSNFFKEIPKIFKAFKWMYLFVILVVAGMIYLGCYAPRGWDIKVFNPIVPLAVTVCSHAFLPLFLNPSLMVLSY